jgi:hypothetical protein
MDGFIYFLQMGSTEFTNLLFMATVLYFLRKSEGQGEREESGFPPARDDKR